MAFAEERKPMDAFDYADAQKAPSRSISALVWNILTVLVLLSAVCIGAVFLMIFTNPNSALNPMKPIPMDTQIILPTSTSTPRQLPPTWTPTPTLMPAPTNTPRPTITLVPTSTTFGAATDTPGPTSPPGPMSFELQPGDPQAIPARVYHPGIGCTFMGISGQALDVRNNAVEGMVVQLGGTLEGRQFATQTTLTGLVLSSDGRYEFTIADHPITSKKTLWVQLLDQSGLVAMSDKIYFDTFDDCERNLIIVNFRQKP
jgi:hypothetical protein